MQKIILTRGIPGSGKTYWAEQFVKDNPDFFNINRDDLRISEFGTYNISAKDERIITYMQDFWANWAFNSGKSIIISDTNLNPKTQKKWMKFAKDKKLEFEFKDFLDIDFEICVERDSKRDKRVGRDVILDMHNKYISPHLYKHTHNNSKENAYIFDIDGTLALMNNRSPYDYSRVYNDIVNINVKLILDSLTKYPSEVKIIIVSGRSAICKNDTLNWLRDKQINYDELYMRTENDNRKDYIVKHEIFMENIDKKYNILGVFDDRDQVVKMWRDLGLTVFQVAYGNF